MSALSPDHPTDAGPAAGRWTAEERAAAFEAYFRTGSRRRARKETGVPERTLSVWLRDERYAEERRAVQAGLLRAVEQDAVKRGTDLAEAMREALLVCRKALRRDPDGKTAGSLLTALSRAREVEDRICRLDGGSATEICGIALTPELAAEFKQWHDEREARRNVSAQDMLRELRHAMADLVGKVVKNRDAGSMIQILEALAEGEGTIAHAVGCNVALARRLHECFTRALDYAEGAARTHATDEAYAAEVAARR